MAVSTRRDQIGVVGGRNVGVRAQTNLQVVVAEALEDRIVRIRVLAAERLGSELGRQRDRLEDAVETRMKEVRDRDSLPASWRARDAMLRRAQIARRRGLQH